jgi:hypothetical protein
METWSESMIELELTRAEAMLVYELLKENYENSLEIIMRAIDEEVTEESMKLNARENYRINIENEAKKVPDLEAEIKQLRAKIDSDNLTSKLNKIKFPEINLDFAPYGYKKDGTPKKRAGRPRIDELPF